MTNTFTASVPKGKQRSKPSDWACKISHWPSPSTSTNCPQALAVSRVARAPEHDGVPHHRDGASFALEVDKSRVDDLLRLHWSKTHVALQRDIHEEFIELVKRSRGARLKGPEKTLFSGEYWTGGKAIELGLADGIGDLRATLRARFGDDVITPLVAPARGWFGRVQPSVAPSDITGLPRAADFAEEIISALEARALWARYGL